MRIREVLDMSANVAIVVTCTYFGTLVYSSYSRTAAAAKPAAAPVTTPRVAAYQVGDTWANDAGIDLGAAETTLVLAFRSQCRFCTDSMPFYRQLAERIASMDRRTRLAAVTTDPLAVGQAYLASHRLVAAQVASTTPAALRVSGTPTLILVDRGGKILRIWRGRLSPSNEADVLNALSGLTGVAAKAGPQ